MSEHSKVREATTGESYFRAVEVHCEHWRTHSDTEAGEMFVSNDEVISKLNEVIKSEGGIDSKGIYREHWRKHTDAEAVFVIIK